MMSRLTQAGAALAVCLLLPRGSSAQGRDLTQWINQVIATRLMQADPGKTPQLPAGTQGKAVIVDGASLPDVAGITIALPSQQTVGGAAMPPATSLSANPLSVLALISGNKALDPNMYLPGAWRRRVGLSATVETDAATNRSVNLYQAKIILLDRGNPFEQRTDKGSSARRADLIKALASSANSFAKIQSAVADTLYAIFGAGQTRSAYVNTLTVPANFEAALIALGREHEKRLEEFVIQNGRSFVELHEAITKLTELSRQRSQLALGFTQRGSGSAFEEQRGSIIWDRAFGSVSTTANLVYKSLADATGGRENAGEVAAQLQWNLSSDDPFDRRDPPALTIAASGTSGEDGRRGLVQLTLHLPMGEGVNVPLSATWASKSSLVNEKRVVGNVGFSFDIADILQRPR